MEFKPFGVLEGDRLYYVIIKGDKNLDSTSGVLSSFGVGMNAPKNDAFNGITYGNSYIWSFRTLPEQAVNNGICALSQVKIDPESKLFKTTANNLNANEDMPGDPAFDTIDDSDKNFIALPLASDGQVLNPLPSSYDWSWALNPWNSSDTNIAAPVPPDTFDQCLIRAPVTAPDGQAVIIATAEIINSVIPTSPAGTQYSGTANVYVFVCDNPWPPVVGGLWQPWMDINYSAPADCVTGISCPNTNYSIYYCRDAGGGGTADDLPAIVSNNTIIRGESNVLVCSDGSGACSSGASAGDVCNGGKGICQSDILKDAYFFREALPTTTTGLGVTDDGNGYSVTATWTDISGSDPAIDAYKLYWGTASYNYSEYAEIEAATGNSNQSDVTCTAGGTISCTISNLTVGTIYYFNITGYLTSTGAESDYWGEVTLPPLTDTTAPGIPNGLVATSRDGSVDLTWHDVAGAYSHNMYYGSNTGTYGVAQNVGSTTAINVSPFTNGKTYYFVITSIDANGVESPYSHEANGTPFAAPFNLTASASSTNNAVIDLSWDLDSAGVNSVNIYWGVISGKYGAPANITGAPTSYSATGLTPNMTYYFVVTSLNSKKEESYRTSEASATTIP